MEGEISFQTSLEMKSNRHDFSIGPAFTFVKLLDGVGPSANRYPVIQIDYQIKSHLYEYYHSSPRTGYHMKVRSRSASKSLSANFNATRIDFEATALLNLMQLDPPAVVLGLRTQAFTTLTRQNPSRFIELPTEFRHFLGGARNLRGFSRNEVPANSNGALTSFYFGSELRFPYVIFGMMDLYVFHDLALVGENTTQLKSTLFHSPGFGIRWGSPIGTFRASFAHGFVLGTGSADEDLSHPQAYLSYGAEF